MDHNTPQVFYLLYYIEAQRDAGRIILPEELFFELQRAFPYITQPSRRALIVDSAIKKFMFMHPFRIDEGRAVQDLIDMRNGSKK